MSEDKGKYQPWCHEEFMADRRVRRMSPLALKTYMMLLHEGFVCSTRPNLPDDEEELELMAYCTDHEEWLSVREIVLGMFEKQEVNGRKVLVKSRLVVDWARLQQIREARVAAGIKGAEARWGSKIANDSTPVANDSKEGRKEGSKESEAKEESQDGQEDVMTKKQAKESATRIIRRMGADPGNSQTTWDLFAGLVSDFGSYRVMADLEQWAKENRGDDFPHGAMSAYVRVAADRLQEEDKAPEIKSPAVTNLTRELAYLYGGSLAFGDKHRIRLAELLQEYSADEIIAVWKPWLDTQDDDPKYLAGKFVQAIDDLCYAARRKKQDQEREAADREAAVQRMQVVAQADLEAAKAEEESPLELPE